MAVSLLICTYHVAVSLLLACFGKQGDSRETAGRKQQGFGQM